MGVPGRVCRGGRGRAGSCVRAGRAGDGATRTHRVHGGAHAMDGSEARGDLCQFIVLGRGSLAGFSSVKSSRPVSLSLGIGFPKGAELGKFICYVRIHKNPGTSQQERGDVFPCCPHDPDR